MTYLFPIGASTPLSPLPPQDEASGADDTTDTGGHGLGEILPQYREKEPPYCPGVDLKKPHVGGLLHPSVAGTQVGSEG